jgi:hypothetical protein
MNGTLRDVSSLSLARHAFEPRITKQGRRHADHFRWHGTLTPLRVTFGAAARFTVPDHFILTARSHLSDHLPRDGTLSPFGSLVPFGMVGAGGLGL